MKPDWTRPDRPKGQVSEFLKNYKNSEILFSDKVSADKQKISQILKSANKLIVIHETTKL